MPLSLNTGSEIDIEYGS